MTTPTNSRMRALLEQRTDSARQTLLILQGALDRFEKNSQVVVPVGTKLTIRTLAQEAGVSKDTPLSRFRKGQAQAGEFRFPDVVARFHKLKEGNGSEQPAKAKKRPQDKREARIHELNQSVADYKRKLLQHDRVLNELDAEVVELRERCRQLTEQNAGLRQNQLKVIPFTSPNETRR